MSINLVKEKENPHKTQWLLPHINNYIPDHMQDLCTKKWVKGEKFCWISSG